MYMYKPPGLSFQCGDFIGQQKYREPAMQEKPVLYTPQKLTTSFENTWLCKK